MHLSVKAWHNVKAVVKICLLAMLSFTFFRLTIIFTNVDSFAANYSERWLRLKDALSAGFYSDIAITSLILLIPVVIMSVLLLANRLSPRILNLVYLFLGTVFIASFLFFSVDIPALRDVNWIWHKRFLCGAGVSGPGVRMPLAGAKFWTFIIIFVVAACFFALLLYKVWQKHKQFLPTRTDVYQTRHYALFIPLMLAVWLMLYLGIRYAC